MKNFIKVMFFSLLVIGSFAGFANFGIPTIVPAPPPEEEILDVGGLTIEGFVAFGDRIFKGKGNCLLCHIVTGGRAPLLDKAAEIAPSRLKDSRYEGAAKNAEAYLYESMVDPSAFVVAGFGVKGTGDTKSPMPNVRSGGIGLKDVEIRAVIAYLQNLSGLEVTVEIPKDADTGDAGKEEEEGRRPVYASVEEVLAEAGCGACHKFADNEGDIGPDLTAIGAARDEAQLRRAILDPNAELTKGYEADLMPPDYGEQLYAKELEMLVNYLASLK